MATKNLPKITKAVDYGDYYELTVVDLTEAGQETGEPYSYVLYEADPYGDAPALRAELHLMVDKGEIVVEAAPETIPGELSEPAPEPRDLYAEIDALELRVAALEQK